MSDAQVEVHILDPADKRSKTHVDNAPARELAVGWAEIRAKLTGLLRFGHEPKAEARYPDQFATVPRMERLRMVYRLVRSQHPRHSPETEEIPPLADEWIAEYDRGRDVVDWYGGAKVKITAESGTHVRNE